MCCEDYSHGVISGPWTYDGKLIESRNDYQKRKAQKAKIKEEYLLIAWLPDRAMDRCMSEDEKERWK